MKTPVLVINFKLYKESVGKAGLALAGICEAVSRESGISVVVAPAVTDLALVAEETSIPVFSQHVDNVSPGSFTGHISAEAIKMSGARGTLINHSERRLRISDIHDVVERCNILGLETIVCTNNVKVSKACASFSPTFIAIEPPELIGGEVSVTRANPKVVSGSVEAIQSVDPNVKVLCGAGVKTGEDVKKAISLGADGVLVASGVVKAADPRDALMDLISGC